MPKAIPPDSFLRSFEYFGMRDGRRIWREGSGRWVRYYTWDSLHGEVEVFNGRGKHLGALDALTRRFIKDADEQKKLNL
ncbi:MAG: hypothetical protein HYX53_16035 [Chloroflexi bacterium]|nr:hypothetical protein [Chloroflexota bacterium]